MLVIFLAGIMPKEYIHEALFEHEDTIHPNYKKGEIVITNKHTHCSFLGFVFAPFVATEKQFFKYADHIRHATVYILPDYNFKACTATVAGLLRGPPIFLR